MPALSVLPQALARLHSMACLAGGGPHHIVPLLESLRPYIGFDAGAYVHPGVDGGGEGTLETYMENPALQAAMVDYFDPRMLRDEHRLFQRSLRQFGEAVRHEHGPHQLEQLLRVPYAELLRSDFFNVLLRPADVAHWASLVLRTPQGRGIGTLILYRHTGSRPFEQEEVAALAPLEASLAGILQPSELEAKDSEVHAQGLLIATLQGQPLWISPESEALMPLAFGWRWRRGAELPPALQGLLRRLVSQDSTTLQPPQLELRNSQGWFSLRATRLAAAHGADDAAAIHITQRVSRGTRLLQALKRLRLPQRQHELAWWLAYGMSEPQIAARMDISINTVVYHRRQLYNRLGVMGRDEFLSQLGWVS
ncbi:helix-turn-helix transcriptional regulator [Ottowia thiooxydans]|uniref:helix-turn-helix transcriptional regulator n=1 Tax=Ottowia thiooxydans TaxID=219182 RepID=UPI00048E5886|nr:helix-turn-helix transcriptional regulator [Ottowia thiooxydans]